MAVTISVGSGKGGTGKSMLAANLALLLAKNGKKVCLVDLDVGGADAHILFGVFEPKYTLTDFLERRVESLDQVTHTLDGFYGLQLIVGTGDTLKTANMPYQTKQRLLRHIALLDADVVLLDVGAGTGFHALDFFMFADRQICVTTPEPTAVLDFYRFLKLAAIRKALGAFIAHDQVHKTLVARNFQTMDEVLDLAEKTKAGARKEAGSALGDFRPWLVINQVGKKSGFNSQQLRRVITRFLGLTLPELGEIPFDPVIRESVSAYMPINEYQPSSAPAKALAAIADTLERELNALLVKAKAA